MGGMYDRLFQPLTIAKASHKGLKAVLTIILGKAFPYWSHERLRATLHDGERSLSIVRIPQEINILHNLWAQSVEPGWRIKIQLQGEWSDIKFSLEEIVKELNSDRDRAKGDEKTDVMQDVTYVAHMYREDRGSIPYFVGKETFKEAFVNQIQMTPNSIQSVLCEVRNVFISPTTKNSARGGGGVLIDTDDVIGVVTLEVHSKPLLHALNAVLQFHTPDEQQYEHQMEYRYYRVTRDNFTDLQRGRFKFPFLDLYHHIDELVAYKSKVDGSRQYHSEEYNEEYDRHIDILVKYLDNQSTVAFSKAKVAWSQRVPVTTFNLLWLLLKPGSDVYVRERGCLNAYVIEYVDKIFRDGTSRPRPYQVKVWNLDYNGKFFRRSSKTISVPIFDGEREIQSLPIFPIRFHQDKEGDLPLRNVLIERGKKFIEVIKQPTYQEYT